MKETFDVVLKLDGFVELDPRLARLTGRPDNRIPPDGDYRWLRRPREEARRIATLAYVYCRRCEVPGQVDVFRHAVDWHPEASDLRLLKRDPTFDWDWMGWALLAQLPEMIEKISQLRRAAGRAPLAPSAP